MSNYNIKINNSNELCHFGVKGMKWGIRRYQNKDGSLTSLGKKRIKLFQNAADRANRGQQLFWRILRIRRIESI